MEKIKSFLGNIAVIIYFITVMWWILLLLPLVPISLIVDISSIYSSGFSKGTNTGIEFIGILGLFIGLSLLVPAFRKMYDKFPWMFPYVKILYGNVVILGIGTTLLNYGYQVQSEARHTFFLVFTVVQIIVCRILMCIYYNKRKVQHIGGNISE